jgi:low affinity Fe/Cu permease
MLKQILFSEFSGPKFFSVVLILIFIFNILPSVLKFSWKKKIYLVCRSVGIFFKINSISGMFFFSILHLATQRI